MSIFDMGKNTRNMIDEQMMRDMQKARERQLREYNAQMQQLAEYDPDHHVYQQLSMPQGNPQVTATGSTISTEAVNLIDLLLKDGMSPSDLYHAIRKIAHERDYDKLRDKVNNLSSQKQLAELAQLGVISKDDLMRMSGIDSEAELKRKQQQRKQRQQQQQKEQRKTAAIALVNKVIMARREHGGSEWFQRSDVMRICRRNARTARRILTLAKEAGMIKSKGRWWKKVKSPSSSKSSAQAMASEVHNVFGQNSLP